MHIVTDGCPRSKHETIAPEYVSENELHAVIFLFINIE